MARTIKERLIEALKARGWSEDPNAGSRKYLTMLQLGGTHPDASRYYLGVSGALRYSSTGTVGASVPHEITKARLLAEVPE